MKKKIIFYFFIKKYYYRIFFEIGLYFFKHILFIFYVYENDNQQNIFSNFSNYIINQRVRHFDLRWKMRHSNKIYIYRCIYYEILHVVNIV